MGHFRKKSSRKKEIHFLKNKKKLIVALKEEWTKIDPEVVKKFS